MKRHRLGGGLPCPLAVVAGVASVSWIAGISGIAGFGGFAGVSGVAGVAMIAGFAAGCGGGPEGDAAARLFVARRVVVDGESYRYRVYLPSGYRGDRAWPVLLFLHGSSERGEDNWRQIRSGLGPAIARDRERFPLVAVFPQCRRGRQWFGAMEDQAVAALEAAVREFHGDRARLYVTGISLGGSGAWYFARHRQRFAAAVPICGEIVAAPDDPFPADLRPDVARLAQARDPYGALAAAIGATPVWAFHGARDDQVPVRQSRAMVAALRRLGGRVRYTEYPDLDHISWDRAYAEPELIPWLLQQTLTGRPGNETRAPNVVVSGERRVPVPARGRGRL